MNGMAIDQPDSLPTRKVGSGLIAGAIVTVLVWVLSLFDVDMPGEVGAAITTILVFVTSYFVRERPYQSQAGQEGG